MAEGSDIPYAAQRSLSQQPESSAASSMAAPNSSYTSIPENAATFVTKSIFHAATTFAHAVLLLHAVASTAHDWLRDLDISISDRLWVYEHDPRE